MGAYLARHFAGGTALLDAPRNMAALAGLVAPLPPLIGMAIGVAASHAGGVPRPGSMPDLAVTWYVADAVGILILTCPVLALLTPGRHRPRVERPIEACALAAALLFVGQAMSGRFLVPSLGEWPLNYLLIPLLPWATFRFGTAGALLAILTVAAVSIIGTVHDFEALPASSPSLSLRFLQLFLGLLWSPR